MQKEAQLNSEYNVDRNSKADMTPSVKAMTLSVLSLVLVATACSPQLGLRLSVPDVPEPQRSIPVVSAGESVRVRVGNFIDSRQSDAVAVIDGRNVSSDGSLGAVVQEGFERYFKEAGANVVLFNAPSIEGEISEWRVTVKPSFPTSEATAVARIKVEIRAAGSTVLYRAGYTGEASSKHPFLSEQGVRELLAKAMGSAIEEAVHDEGLVNALALNRTE